MGNDLSFNIVALDKASTTFVRIAAQLDKVADRLDKLDGKTAEVSVNVKTDESTKALDSFDTRFKLMAGGIIAASPLAGAAIIGGIGAGFIGVAALAVKSNKDVTEAYTGMWHNVVNETKGATAQLAPQFIASAKQIDSEAQKLGPQLKTAFAAAGPDLVALTRGGTEFAHNVMPGITTSVQNSLPVFSSAANVAGTLGTAIGNSAASASQHATEYGTVITSVGNITGSVITGAIGIVNDLADAWAENANQIDGAVGGVVTSITGLADGVLPVLSFGFGAVATVVDDVVTVLGPLAPILGAVGGVALTTWAAFKIAGLVAAGVNALAMGVVNLGGNMEVGAAKSATFIAAQQGVAVESSAAAVAVKAAGASAATASVGIGAAASSIAGPLGIALVAGTLALGLFASSEDDTKVSSDDLKSTVDNMTSAFEASHGAVTQGVIDNLQNDSSFKKVTESAKQFGVTQTDIINAVTGGGPALDQLRAKLQAIIDAHKATPVNAGRAGTISQLDEEGAAAQHTLQSLNDLTASLGSSKAAADANAKAVTEHASALVVSQAGQSAAGRAARTLGLDLGTVTTGFQAAAQSGGDAAASAQDVAVAFAKSALSIAQANQGVQDHFANADKAVAAAKEGVANATDSYQHSITAVSDAQHSAAQASAAVTTAEQGVADAARGVTTAKRAQQDAIDGVATAQENFLHAQKAELDAQLAVNAAREQAIEDLKAIHLQLDDAVVSEESARVRLFEQQQNVQGFGITDANAKDVAGETVTASNIDKVKAAIDLVSAQNALNNALNSGANLRKDVADADSRGIDKAKGVLSAQDSLVSAQEQVKSSAKGVTKAQQQVEDANYGLAQADRNLERAHQGVADAAYGEQKAHQAVTDAQEASNRSASALEKAKGTLSDATAADSRSLDINTKAGQDNLNQLLTLWGAISATGMTTQDKFNAMVSNTATAFGMSKDAASDYLKQLGLIPADFKYSVTAVAGIDAQGIFDKVELTNGASPANPTGRARLFADGGRITGPGGPRSDVIPIMASHNEYMQPADAVDYYGVGFMEDVRQKKLPKGYADGGLVTQNKLGAANLALATIGAKYQANANAAMVMGIPGAHKGLPKYVPPPVVAYGGGPGGAIPTGEHLALIDQALAFVGISKDQWPMWESGLNTLITRESGWHPNIVNTWDSNAMAGHPSGGLMQTIASTFAGNRDPRLPNNMFDPLANVVAGINYINRTYHGIQNVQQANPNAPKKGYADGGLITGHRKPSGYDSGGWLMPGSGGGVNNLTKPEAVLTPRESEAYVSQAKKAAAGPTEMSGVLYLEDGALLGRFKAYSRQAETAAGPL